MSLVVIDDPFGDGKSQPKAAALPGAGARFFGAVEAIEDVGQIFRGDAGAGIAHDQARLLTDALQAQGHFTAAWRVLDGVAH